MSLTAGSSKQFTIGSGMSYGQTVTVNWGAVDEDGGEHTGSATYKKVDPNATITIYCKASAAPNLYVWDNSLNQLNGGWPGNKMSATTTVSGQQFFYQTFADVDAINIIFNMNGNPQTVDITNITEDTYFTYDGGATATKITVDDDPTNITVKADKTTGRCHHRLHHRRQYSDGKQQQGYGHQAAHLHPDYDATRSSPCRWGSEEPRKLHLYHH